VVATDHPHDALAVAEADGTLIPEVEDSNALPLEARLRDAQVVLDALPRLVPQAGPDAPIGMFGHSRGAAATPEFMFRNPRVTAGVGLDVASQLFGDESAGVPRGEVLSRGLDRAFGVMCSLDVPCADPRVVDLVSVLRGPHAVRQLPISHTDYSDWVVFNAQAQRADPAVGAILDGLAPSRTLHSLRAGRRAMAAERRFVSTFMARHLAAR
jgi:hypothetical protein